MTRSPLVRRSVRAAAGAGGAALAVGFAGLVLAGCAATTSSEVGEFSSPVPSAVWSAGPSTTAAAQFEGNPFDEAAPWTDPDSSAAAAAAGAEADGKDDDARLLSRLAQVPTATWLLPEAWGPGAVGQHVADVVTRAHDADRVPVLVVYGAPGRDCINDHSKGGLDSEEYLGWVAEIAEAAGPRSVVVLEPDALASIGRCSLDHDRTRLLADAIGILSGGPTTYVDAGHSGWLAAGVVAQRLEQVGVERIRGFAVNVSGFGDEPGERAWAEHVADRLTDRADARGAESAYVIDTSRAGNGSDGTWCNPTGRAVGAVPASTSPGRQDARLWLKPPGDSDGACGGGPEAGTFWTDRALEMLRAAGW